MKRVAIIGGGPAGLMAASELSAKYEVHVFEKQRNIGRKFLVAGEGGFNLTNEFDGDALVEKYTPRELIGPMIQAFGSAALREWLARKGIPTFVGSSGRVFPIKGIKPIQVLNAIREHLVKAGVIFHTRHEFIGFDDRVVPIIKHNDVRIDFRSDHYLFALGGASWPSTGSTGAWAEAFRAKGIEVVPFRSSNCGVEIDLPAEVLVHAGKPLKNIMLTCGAQQVRGECLITDHGLEGNAIYPLVPLLRERLEIGEEAILILDLKPDLGLETLSERLRDTGMKEWTRAARLDRHAHALVKAYTDRDLNSDPQAMARSIKQLRLPVRALRPIAEAISTVGGVAWRSVNPDLSIKGQTHLVVMGEMLDWDAPTGGFLLQGAFSTGYWAGRSLAQQAIGEVGRNTL